MAVIQPFEYVDPETGDIVSLTVSARYSIFSVNGTSYYFIRESGEFDGTSVQTRPDGPILTYEGG